MSIGPSQQDEVVAIRPLERTRLAFMKGVTGYLAHPAYYLFYGAFTATLIGLFCGMSFSQTYYLFLGFLAGIELKRLFWDTSAQPGEK